jgi:hypothetical protein
MHQKDKIFVLDSELVRKVYAELWERDDSLKGGQPLMFLECVLYKRLSDDSKCKKCRNYETCCYHYFRAFRKEKELFKRS